jgi:hypothetical protein
MAKKARKKLEDDAEASSFQFPEFDEPAFMAHEFEQTIAMGFALVVAVALAAVSFALDRGLSGFSQPTLQWLVPLAVSIGVIAFSPLILRRLRTGAPEYTRGDWATVILLEVFGWLGFWFLISDVFGPH